MNSPYMGKFRVTQQFKGAEHDGLDLVGIEGSTGRSTGSHCHYCIRKSLSRGTFVDVCEISGIPNVEGGVYDDGYRPGTSAPATAQKKTKQFTITVDGTTYSGELTEK